VLNLLPNQYQPAAVPKQDFYTIRALRPEHNQRSIKWLCGAPHNHSYVSHVIMWRRDPDTANRAAMTNFAAT
jgi:hypothetical protein